MLMTTDNNETSTPQKKGRQIYQMSIAEIIDHTPTIREVVLRCQNPEAFHFRAGQFVMLHVPAVPKPQLRAYSIASTEHEKSGFRLIFKYVENGLASKFIWALSGNETLEFTGPFGRVFFNTPPTEQVIFLNTGSGVSQHFSFIESNLEKHPNLKYRLLFGVRREEDIYYREELERLKLKLKDFQYEFVLSRPSSTWTGKKGYVQDFIDDLNYLETPSTFYLCGNGGMIKDVKAKLGENGFDSKLIFSEAFD